MSNAPQRNTPGATVVVAAVVVIDVVVVVAVVAVFGSKMVYGIAKKYYVRHFDYLHTTVFIYN